jgi:hypothetical protein
VQLGAEMLSIMNNNLKLSNSKNFLFTCHTLGAASTDRQVTIAQDSRASRRGNIPTSGRGFKPSLDSSTAYIHLSIHQEERMVGLGRSSIDRAKPNFLDRLRTKVLAQFTRIHNFGRAALQHWELIHFLNRGIQPMIQKVLIDKPPPKLVSASGQIQSSAFNHTHFVALKLINLDRSLFCTTQPPTTN